MAAPTKAQRDTLMRLGRLTGLIPRADGVGRWIHDKDCGGPASLDHLHDKGLVERRLDFGPRGGERYYYRPNEAGWKIIERARAKRIEEADREMTLAGIDTALIEARKNGTIVCVFSGPTMYYRGIPGEVFRGAESHRLMLRIGQRCIPLASITKVEAA